MQRQETAPRSKEVKVGGQRGCVGGVTGPLGGGG